MHTPRFVRKIQAPLRSAVMALGIDRHKHTEDRRVLEEEIFPYFVASSVCRNVLFVGCAWYTRGYNTVFKDKDYRTLERDPAENKYGAKRHIHDSLENVTRHVEAGSLDLIVCNGIFGWGLDDRPGVEKAFEGCYDSLNWGGILVLGWNDTPERCPFPLEECRSLKSFQPFVFPPLAAAHYRVAGSSRHTYSFFVKRSPL